MLEFFKEGLTNAGRGYALSNIFCAEPLGIMGLDFGSVFGVMGDIKSFACHVSGSQRHDVSVFGGFMQLVRC